MAKTRGKGFHGFLGDRDAEDVRKRFIDEPLAASQQPVLDTAFRTMQFLAEVPDAVVASRRRELERVRASGGAEDPRLALLDASIEYAGRARTAANLARTRVQRIAAAMMGEAVLFHGFVSTESLSPLEGMTVRLERHGDEKDARALTATTDKDGYFSVPRPGKDEDIWRARKAVDEGTAQPTDAAEDRAVSVEIADAGGKIVHRDPVPLHLGGTAYREYMISVA